MSVDTCKSGNSMDIPKPDGFFGIRHLQYGLLTAASIIAYGIRTVLNTYPEWASKKNLMLSSFFWGYVCFQIGAGQLARNYGPKLFLGTAIFICSIFTVLVPVFGAQFGYGGVIACRVIQGMCQGFLYPSTHNLLSLWSPVQDRATVGSFVYAGLFVPAVALISLSFVGSTQKEVTIFILVIAVGFNAGVFSGFNVNHIDISPTHSGTLMGITNSTDKALWDIVFCIAAGVYIVTGSFYIFAASGEVQPWDKSEVSDKTENKSEKIAL
ncbi:hypothetical protein NQ314_017447 [Rhamnusium bicolor]|uniref:Major facilitator superfamily (MFS) profile domain-containing protein n=1 Tax=Rhamnusium bicolor TaxID=1586634 RepID=A0AAV8WTA6_9CUCU|nr:hypothetical protein NQ314_017447 [Rhamnusium bicolor]